jgi:taurine dioxygenase
VSGRRILNVNAQFCVKLRGLRDDESSMILQYLYSRAAIPEYQLRLRWAPNTVVMWDNRSVQHYAAHDYYPQRRTMERVTVAGDAVIGVSGPYAPEENVEALPDGKGARIAPPGQRPIREFERDLY